MKTPGLIAIVVAAIFLMSSARSQDDVELVRKKQQDDSMRRVKELRQQHVAALKKVANLVSEEFKRGLASPFIACDAQLEALEAEAAAADNKADQLKYMEDCVNFAREYEKLADVMRTSARRNYTDLARLKARRLEAEINLELARSGYAD